METSSFYKNSELAEEFSVSSMTISRYIDSAKTGLNDLELYHHGNDYKIRKTELNRQIIKMLVGDKSKFKNPTRFKTITPTKDFYTKYTFNNQLEMIRELKNSKMINTKFAYLGNNIDNYSKYQQSRKKNLIRAEILNNNLPFFINYAIKNDIKYNLIELGSMDLVSSKTFIEELAKNNLIDSFLALDISESLLALNEKIFKNYFPSIKYTSEVLDIEQEDLYEYVLDNKFQGNDPTKTINLFLLIGSTSANFIIPNRVYRNISDALQVGDFFILDLIKEYPEIEKNKVYDVDSLFYKFIVTPLKDLGFSDSDITVKSSYDKIHNLRNVVAVMNDNLNLNFVNLSEHLELKKGSEIILSINRTSYKEEMDRIRNYKFDLINLNTSINLDYVNCVYKKITQD
jgi:uncharacterized SAM-dependent methyltransferase